MRFYEPTMLKDGQKVRVICSRDHPVTFYASTSDETYITVHTNESITGYIFLNEEGSWLKFKDERAGTTFRVTIPIFDTDTVEVL